MPGAIDYSALRTTMVALVKSFGKTASMKILRAVEGTAPDPTLPWRRNAATIKSFSFIGVSSTVGFPAQGVATSDDDKTFIIPGDIVTTAADGDAMTICGGLQYTDRILLGTIEYQILGIQDVTPDDLPIIIKVRGRAWQPLAMQPPQGV